MPPPPRSPDAPPPAARYGDRRQPAHRPDVRIRPRAVKSNNLPLLRCRPAFPAASPTARCRSAPSREPGSPPARIWIHASVGPPIPVHAVSPAPISRLPLSLPAPPEPEESVSPEMSTSAIKGASSCPAPSPPGVDGSAASFVAATWAARKAEIRATALHLVATWSAPNGTPSDAPEGDTRCLWATRSLDLATDLLRSRHPQAAHPRQAARHPAPRGPAGRRHRPSRKRATDSSHGPLDSTAGERTCSA